MILKFPSGNVSVSIQDLQTSRQCQSACGICDEPWVFQSDGCTGGQLLVLHPCQHLVGSGCWASVPNENKDKCPLCKVAVSCEEKVRVHTMLERFALAGRVPNEQDPEGQRSDSDDSGMGECVNHGLSEGRIVQNMMGDGLDHVDVRRIIYFMNLRVLLDATTESLNTSLSTTKALTPAHRESLILFLANTPLKDQDSMHRKVEVALAAFNICSGTYFTMNDLRKTLASGEEWVKAHFAAILKDSEKTNKDVSDVRKAEKKIENAKTELRKLKDRQSQDSARRLKAEIKLAAVEIEKKAEKEVAIIRAKASAEAAEIYSKADGEVAKARAKAKEDVQKLEKHGRLIKK